MWYGVVEKPGLALQYNMIWLGGSEKLAGQLNSNLVRKDVKINQWLFVHRFGGEDWVFTSKYL